MENPEEILHSLEEFAKLRPKSIPRELEEYLCFVAKTGDPVYQWSAIKCLFREKLISVVTEFYESCPSVSIPSCRNVDLFNYDTMKTFILEKLDTFVAAPFTVQRICELLTTPRKEYNRIDKYMRALEKNILVVSTTEPGSHRTPENGDGFVNGVESDHAPDGAHDINIEEMDDEHAWPAKGPDSYQSTSKEGPAPLEKMYAAGDAGAEPEAAGSRALETVICSTSEDQTFVTVPLNDADPAESGALGREEKAEADAEELHVGNEDSLDADAVPAVVQRRRTSIEPESDNAEAAEQPMQLQESTEAAPSEEKVETPAESTETPAEQEVPETEAEDKLSDEELKESKYEATEAAPAAETAASGDASPSRIAAADGADGEQVEIDVTSLGAASSATGKPASPDTQTEPGVGEPTPDEVPMQVVADGPTEQDQSDAPQIPQETPSQSAEPPQEARDPPAEAPPSSDGAPEMVEKIEVLEPLEESASAAIASEQKVLETAEPDAEEAPAEPAPPTAMDVDAPEAPSVGDAPADSNN